MAEEQLTEDIPQEQQTENVEQAEQPEQNQQATQQDPPSKLLYNALVGKKLYTKSYDDFKQQFSNQESVSVLYKAMENKGLYTKGSSEFQNQFFPEISKPTQKQWTETSALSPMSVINKKPEQQPAPVTAAPKTTQKEKPSTPSDDTFAQIVNAPQFGGLGTAIDYGKYVWNKLVETGAKMTAGTTKGIVRALAMADPQNLRGGAFGGLPINDVIKESDKLANEIKESSKGMELSVDEKRKKDFDNNFVASAVASIPSLALQATVPAGLGFAADAFDTAIDNINNSEEGKKLPESLKTIYGTANAASIAVLSEIGLDKIVGGKLLPKLSSKLTAETITDLLGKSSEPITKKVFESALKANAGKLKNTIVTNASKLGHSAAVGTAFMGANEALNIMSEKMVNAYADKDIFEPTSFGQGFMRVVKAGAEGMAFGLTMGGVHLPFAKADNYIKDRVAESKSSEDIDAIKTDIADNLKAGKINQQQSDVMMNLVDQYQGINSSIPSEVPNKTQIIDKIKQSNDLRQEAQNITLEAQNLHPAFQEQKLKEAQDLHKVADDIDSSLSGNPKYKIGEQTVDKDTFVNFINSPEAEAGNVSLSVENDNATSDLLNKVSKEKGWNVNDIQEEGLPKSTIVNKKQEYDTENITGVPSKVGIGEEPIQTEPIKGGSAQEISGGGILQENVPSREGKVEEKPQEIEALEEAVPNALKDVESTNKALEKISNEDYNKLYELKQPNLTKAENEILASNLLFDEHNERIKNANEKYKEEATATVSEAYHKAKADGSNPELVKAVEELLGKPTEKVGEEAKIEKLPKYKNKSIAERFSKGLEAASIMEGGEIHPEDIAQRGAWRSMGKNEFTKLLNGGRIGGFEAKKGNYFGDNPFIASSQKGEGKYLVEFGGKKVIGETTEQSVSLNDITGVWKFENGEWNKLSKENILQEISALEKAKPTEKVGEEAKAELPKTEKKPKIFSIDDKEDFYHGSYNKREGKLRTNTAEQFGDAVYFTTSKEEAEGNYPHVTKVKLNIENPIYAGEGEWNKVEKLALEKENANKERDEDGNIIGEVFDLADITNSNNISDAAKELGYDAIILRGEGNHENETAVLDPNKIIYPKDESNREKVSGTVQPTTEAKPTEVTTKPIEVVKKEGVGEVAVEISFPEKLEVSEVKPYTQLEQNYYKPNQQLKFNQGTYEPVRIIAHPDIIKAISIGSKLIDANKRKLVSEYDAEFARDVAKKLGYVTDSGEGSTNLLNRAVKEIAKQYRTNTHEVFVVFGEESKLKTSEPTREKVSGTVQPVSEVPKEQKTETGVQPSARPTSKGESETTAPVLAKEGELPLSKDTKAPFETKSKKQIVKREKEGGLVEVFDKNGKNVSRKTEKKALREYAKAFDFSIGKTGEEIAKEKGESIRGISDIIDNSENPLELAEIYVNEEPTMATLSDIEVMIGEYGIYNIKPKSFAEYNDKNNITLTLAKRYLSRDKKFYERYNADNRSGLDVVAKEMSDHYFPDGDGTEISPEDLADFMVRFPSGNWDKLTESENAYYAGSKFEKLTGLILNREIADIAIENDVKKLNAQEKKLLENEYKNQSELESDYWDTYAKTDGFTKEIPISEIEQKEEIKGKPVEASTESAKELAKPKRTKQPGKYESMMIEAGKKLDEVELPSFLKAKDTEGMKKAGLGEQELKDMLKTAMVTMGRLMDKGVEFSEALKVAVKDLVKSQGEENRDIVEKGFASYYKENAKETEVKEEEPRYVGVSHARINESANRMGLPEIKRNAVLTPLEYAERGRKLIESGVDPLEISNQFKKDGLVDADRISIVRGHLEKLEKNADEIGKRYGFNSNEYKNAAKEVYDWEKNVVKPMGSKFAEIGFSLQGARDLNTDSFTYVKRQVEALTGVETTKEQDKKIEELTTVNQKLQQKVDDIEKKLIEATTKAFETKEKKVIEKKFSDKLRSLANKIRNTDFLDKLGLGAAPDAETKGVSFNMKEAVAKALEHIADGVDKAEAIARAIKEFGVDKKEIESIINKIMPSANDLEDLQKMFLNKKDNKFSPEEASAIWEYAKSEYLNKGIDYKGMISKVADDIGLTWRQVAEAITSPKDIKKISNEMWVKRSNLLKNQNATKRWIEEQNKSGIWKAVRKFTNSFRGAAIFGHGGIFVGTHAGMNLFSPSRLKVVIPAFFNGYKFAYGNRGAYEMAMEELRNSENYITAQRAGLQNNPDVFNVEEYQKYQTALGKLGMVGQQGFNAIKVLRQQLFDAEFNKLTDVEKSDPKVAESVAQIINLATGATNLKVPNWVGEVTFAGGMEAARWGKLTRSPLRATETALKAISSPEKVSTADKVFAKIWARRIGEQLGTFATAIAVNAAIQNYLNPKNKVNIANPFDPDHLKFKIGDVTIDPTSGMLQPINFIKGVADIATKEQRELMGRTRLAKEGELVLKYARGKLSPFYGTAIEQLVRTDYRGNVLPYFSDKPQAGKHKLTYLEYALSKAPLPVAEAMGEMYNAAAKEDSDRITTNHVMDGILSGALSGGTGFKVKVGELEPYIEKTQTFMIYQKNGTKKREATKDELNKAEKQADELYKKSLEKIKQSKTGIYGHDENGNVKRWGYNKYGELTLDKSEVVKHGDYNKLSESEKEALHKRLKVQKTKETRSKIKY